MKLGQELKSGVYYVGVNDLDKEKFDNFIPLPDGTSYNAYLIKDEKIVLIDTVEDTKEKELMANLKSLGVDRIDYIVSNHAEQDHSGSLNALLLAFPEAMVVTNSKCKDFLKELLLVPEEKFKVIADSETLNIGKRNLEFIIAPWVHWPETMFTYLKEDKILFSCDFLGSHLASDELFVGKDDESKKKVYDAAKRYYAEIMMPFRGPIRKYLDKISGMDIEIVAPSHGQVYDNLEFIINAYKDWASDDVKNQVVIPYVTMHGSTEKIVNYFSEKLKAAGIDVKTIALPTEDIGELAVVLVDAATVVIGSPAFQTSAHLEALAVADIFRAIKPKTKYASVIGSYGWMKDSAVKPLVERVGFPSIKLFDPVSVKGFPKEDDYKELDRLAGEIIQGHKTLGVLK